MVEKSQSVDITTSMINDRSMNRLVNDTTNASHIGNSIFAPDNFKKDRRLSKGSRNPLKRLKSRMPKKGQAHVD